VRELSTDTGVEFYGSSLCWRTWGRDETCTASANGLEDRENLEFLERVIDESVGLRNVMVPFPTVATVGAGAVVTTVQCISWPCPLAGRIVEFHLWVDTITGASPTVTIYNETANRPTTDAATLVAGRKMYTLPNLKLR